MVSRAINAEVVRSVGFENISSVYEDLGIALTKSLVVMLLTNTTNKTLFVSENGSDDHYRLPSGASVCWDFQANSRSGDIRVKPVGMQFSVKGIVQDLPNVGEVVLEGQSI